MGKFKNAKVVSFSLCGDLVFLLEECAKSTGYTKTGIVEQALTDYFKNGSYVKTSNASAIAQFSTLVEKTFTE